MSEKSQKLIRKNARDGWKADLRWDDKDKTLQRRTARLIKTVIRSI